MRLHFFSRDQLASIIVGQEHYVTAFIRGAVPVVMFLSARNLIEVINSTFIDEGKEGSGDSKSKRVGLRETFGISFDEAVRLKECYIDMKTSYGHDL